MIATILFFLAVMLLTIGFSHLAITALTLYNEETLPGDLGQFALGIYLAWLSIATGLILTFILNFIIDPGALHALAK